MIPLAVPTMTGKERDYLLECVETNYVSSVGSFVTRFEEMVATASGAAGTVATSAGTTALHAALIAVGVKPGDLVATASFTFIATANAISHCGASPWLFDVGADDWTMDPHQLTSALERDTSRQGTALVHRPTGRRVAAILPVFTLGLPARMDEISALGRRFGLPVVVDGAAALGATYRDRPSASLGADLTMFSFNGNKTVTAGGGGAVAGTDLALLRRVRHLTTTARVGDDYTHDEVGYNYRMTNLQAAVGCAQMESLDRFVAAKRRIAGRYNSAFHSIRDACAFPEPEDRRSACWFSGLYLPTVAPDVVVALRASLVAAGVDARPFWRPVHLQAPYQNCPAGPMAVTDRIWNRILTLPCSTGLAEHEQEQVIAAVHAAIRALG